MLTAEHMQDAYNQSNYAMVKLSNLQPNLWKSELIEQELTQGTATYALPARVVMILLAYIQTGSGTSAVDRVLGPLSTVEYAALTNKSMQAPPSSFWFNRKITPEITLWQVPDADDTYTLFMRCVSQIQDVSIKSGTTLDIPYRWLDAFTADLAYRLSRIHAPQLEQQRKMDANDAWEIAARQDTENVPLMIIPGLSGYFR